MSLEHGWIPTHDGKRTKTGAIRDPYIRNADTIGPLKPYLPFFATKGEANAWCNAVDAVPLACNIDEARRVAERFDAELVIG